jgi:hypothetical protein
MDATVREQDGGLLSVVTDGGKNWSLGQRQVSW